MKASSVVLPAAILFVAAASTACGTQEKPYQPKPAYSGRAASIPQPPNLPPLTRKDGDDWTVNGLTHDIRSDVHHQEVEDKKLTVVGYIVKTNLVPCKDKTTLDGKKDQCVPECAVPGTKLHPEKTPDGRNAGDPEGCKAPVPTFWIADKKDDTSGETIQVMGWASNFSAIYRAIKAMDKTPKDKRKDDKDFQEAMVDESTNVTLPDPIPAVGAKVKVTGQYGSTATTSSGLIADPFHGIVHYESVETIEEAPELANLPTMPPRKEEKK
jgi:hypothetical protein